MVWWQHTMVWCEHTIVCWQQTINETRLRPTEAEHSNGLFHALQTKPATRRRVNQKEEITREDEAFTVGYLRSKALAGRLQQCDGRLWNGRQQTGS